MGWTVRFIHSWDLAACGRSGPNVGTKLSESGAWRKPWGSEMQRAEKCYKESGVPIDCFGGQVLLQVRLRSAVKTICEFHCCFCYWQGRLLVQAWRGCVEGCLEICSWWFGHGDLNVRCVDPVMICVASKSFFSQVPLNLNCVCKPAAEVELLEDMPGLKPWHVFLDLYCLPWCQHFITALVQSAGHISFKTSAMSRQLATWGFFLGEPSHIQLTFP